MPWDDEYFIKHVQHLHWPYINGVYRKAMEMEMEFEFEMKMEMAVRTEFHLVRLCVNCAPENFLHACSCVCFF